jgi:putative endonuclease
MFYVYLIQSEVDSSFYIGYTSNLELRIKQHNNGESIYSRRKKPWKLVYSEEFENKTFALKRERFLKKQKNKDFYYQLIKSLDRQLVG